ncbi:MAG: LPS-assembly protein LptD [Hyphomicrobiaceae bacterium]
MRKAPGTSMRVIGHCNASVGRCARVAAPLALACAMMFAPTFALAQDPATIAPETSTPRATFSGQGIPIGGARLDRAKPLYLQGDELIYDSRGSKVTARGNVEIFYNDYVLTADEVVYDQSANTLSAKGNVTLRDPNGSITRSERITLTDDFRDGFVQSLSIVSRDQSRITARRAVRRDGNVTEFEDGKFTPCQHEAGKPPLWCVSARRVIHDQDAATITYLDGTFDILGVPVLYLPYFQHADPSVKRKSGFLMPTYGTSEDLGFAVEVPYYFALSPHYDFTFHPMYTTRQGVLWKGDWRQRLAFGNIRGSYNIKLAGIDQDASELSSSDDSLDGWRGSIESRGEFSLASWWKLGWNGIIESDDSFRRFYKLDNILQTDRVNTAYVQGLSERNHFSVRGYHFGGLLLTDNDNAESRVHPIVDWNYVVGTPILGGQLSWNVNALSFSRDQSFVDSGGVFNDTGTTTQRLVADVNWRRRIVDPLGITYTPFANLRGDVFTFDNAVDPIANEKIDDRTVTRGVASAGLLASYPWMARTATSTHVVEPIGQIIARTGSVEQRNLPNEDARSIVFDDTNLFELNKTSGLDRVETGTRVNAGVQYTFQSQTGGYARVLAGQSYHLSGENIYAGELGNEPSTDPGTAPNLSSENNGLDDDRSDYVLGAYLAPSQAFQLIGQGRFDEDDLTLVRADVAGRASYGPFRGEFIYTYAGDDPLSGQVSADQQDILGIVNLQIAERWSLAGSLRYDIDEEEARQSSVALRYADDCFVLTTSYVESFIEDESRDITTDRAVVLRFELKHLGDFSYRADALDHLFGENQG